MCISLLALKKEPLLFDDSQAYALHDICQHAHAAPAQRSARIFLVYFIIHLNPSPTSFACFQKEKMSFACFVHVIWRWVGSIPTFWIEFSLVRGMGPI